MTVGAVVEPAEQHIGQHVEARHQVELLEDHGAVALPARRAPTAEGWTPRRLKRNRRPRLGSIRRLIMRSRVDLPAPERPMMPTIWPSGMTMSTPLTAVCLPNRRVTARTSRVADIPASLFDAAFRRLSEFGLIEPHEGGVSVPCQFCCNQQRWMAGPHGAPGFGGPAAFFRTRYSME